MRVFRAGAIVCVAASLVTGWTLLDPAIKAASSPTGPPTFYVRPGGHDTAAGTSPATAWRTLARASRAVLRPGTRLLLLGGNQYHGSLLLSSADAGNAKAPVLVSSYGKGRATIVSSTNGIMVFDTSGVTIRDLVITGNGAGSASTAGIQMYSDRTSGRLGHVFVSKVDISGFGFGIAIGATHDGAGFRNVRVASSALHSNLDAGLASYGPDFDPAAPGYAHQGIYLSHVRAFRNLGDPANTIRNTGSGIELGSVAGAKVVNSQAYGNGGAGGSVTEGPIGMWAYDSTRVVMAHDVSHGNKSSNVHDGGGFGLDRETSRSVLEYDLSYGNHGAGLLLYSAPAAPAAQNGNVIRFNISYGDARARNHVIGGMAVGGRVNNASLYQNTVVIAGSNSQPAFKTTGVEHHIRVLNNILVAASGPVVETVQRKTTREVFFAGNDYYVAPGRTWLVQWGKSSQYLSLATWRGATGDERVNGKPTGHVVAPRFIGPLTGSGGGVGFKLGHRSKLIQAGINLRRLFGIHPGAITFSGQAYQVLAPNVGAQ
ncbi:MAG TPA: hypothetical protein VF983_15110 [Streptosporangiaceae bacterium]